MTAYASSSRTPYPFFDGSLRAICCTRDHRSDLYEVRRVSARSLTLAQGTCLPEGEEVEVWLFPQGRPSVWSAGRIVHTETDGALAELIVALEQPVAAQLGARR